MRNLARSDSFSGPINEAQAVSTAGGGTVLGTSLVQIALIPGTTHFAAVPQAFSGGATVCKMAFNPYLLILTATGAFGTVTDYSSAGQNPNGTGVSLSSFPTTSFLYIGSHEKFRGVNVTMSASVNSNLCPCQ